MAVLFFTVGDIMLSNTILVGVTVETKYVPLSKTVIKFTHRVNALFFRNVLTKLENHIRKMLQTLEMQLLLSTVFGRSK